MAITLTGKDTLQVKESRNLGIYNFGEDNLYPNYNAIFAMNSGSLKACLNVYERFLFGLGMSENKQFWKRKINIYGLRVDQFLRRLVAEFGTHDAVAFKVVYNALGEKVGFIPMRFETLRLAKSDDFGMIKKIKYHEDWSSPRIRKEDIIEYDVYNPDIDVVNRQAELAGGWDKYRGQIYYYGKNGEVKYTHSSFHSVLEDVITDIQLKKGKNANVSTNFLASHIIQLPFTFQQIAEQLSTDGENIDADQAKSKFVDGLHEYQGNENLGKILLLENTFTDNDGKMREFKINKLDMQDYDKINEFTEKTIKENIRQNYSILPILLQEVATGFSTEILSDAYKYYNELTTYGRMILEEIFIEIFENFEVDITTDLTIKQLNFNETT